MSVYWRYKQSPAGFRALVELLELTPPPKRTKMIAIGAAEDSKFTTRALEYVMEFQDVISLPEMELAEVLAGCQPRVIALAILSLETSTREIFLRCSPPRLAAEVKSLLEIKAPPRDISGAQMKLIAKARELERKGLVHTKQIPNAA